ncbi:MAG: hypothetical protein AB7P40_13925 [Chloroflexota bacterium]
MHLGPDGPAARLFTPASGALFVTAGGGLQRSDDAGATWTPVSLPPRPDNAAVEVDPTNHQTVYAATSDGLQCTDDGGTTWTPIFPTVGVVRRIAVSPADPGVLYVAQGGKNTGDFWFHRSLDGGATWEQLDEQHYSSCVWGVALLTPHPTDAARVFKTAGCYAGRDLGDVLEESRDHAATWQTIFRPKTAFPKAIVGGSGADPARYYLAVNNDFRAGGSSVLTSLDDAATWTPILEHTGGGSMAGARQSSTIIGGLAYDPTLPDHAFVGLNVLKLGGPVLAASVTMTADGGASWTPAGAATLPTINDLALGIDGKNLFAATEQGVWRLALG